jgi:NAD(P)-dependent dehydrogenase (short-subunit alcohol dehydrogenase family)
MTLADRFRLDGLGAVVTGSGQGIGRGIAVGLAECGADVVVTARREADLLETARQVEAAGRRAVVVVGDVRDPGMNDRLAATAVEAFGHLGVWVNNVGGSDEKTTRLLVDTPDDVWRSQLELNLTSAFLGAKAAARAMGDAGGVIVNIASGAGTRGSPRTGPYAAAKAGMINLTQTLALELAPRIRVNVVSPGQVPTEAFREVLGADDDRLVEMAAATPLGRLGTPEDVAGAVAFLASPAASWITGEHVLVAGGRTDRGGSRERYG